MRSEASLANLRPPWQPGQSANTVGAKGYREVLKLCRTKSPAAIKVLIACMEDEAAPWPSRIAAATTIVDRAWGKPKEHVQIDGDGIASLRIEFVDPRTDTVSRETITVTPETIDGIATKPEAPEQAAAFEVSFEPPPEET